jgi:hypothetical protein
MTASESICLSPFTAGGSGVLSTMGFLCNDAAALGLQIDSNINS